MSKALWIALLGGVSAWTAHLLLSYLLADLGCRGDTWTLLAGRHALTAVAVVAVIAVTASIRPSLVGQATASSAAVATPSTTQADSSQTREHRFLAHLAFWLNLIFLFAIVMAGSTSLFLAPCM